MEFGWPLPKRVEFLQKVNKAPKDETHTVYFQGIAQQLAIRKVPIELPKYRLDNGRTRAAQAEYLSTHQDLPPDLFSKDPESTVAQQAQHAILKQMLGGAEKDLLKYFKSRIQIYPFVLSDSGFVVNGNRRLCAFRELIEKDETNELDNLRTLQVVILPPADERDIDRLEAAYQLTEDIKLDYSWTARAYMLRARQQEHGFSESELAGIYQIARPEVVELLNILGLAEEYLEERGQPNQYNQVDGAEFAFRALKKEREKVKNEPEKALLQQLAFVAIEDWDSGRVYSAIPKIAENLNKIRQAVIDEFPVPSETVTDEAAALLGLAQVKVDPLIKVLQDDDKRQEVRSIMADVIESSDESKRENKRANRTLFQLNKAHELLKLAYRSYKHSKDKVAVSNKLDEIEDVVYELKEKIDGKPKN